MIFLETKNKIMNIIGIIYLNNPNFLLLFFCQDSIFILYVSMMSLDEIND